MMTKSVQPVIMITADELLRGAFDVDGSAETAVVVVFDYDT